MPAAPSAQTLMSRSDRILASPPVAGGGRWASRHRLRVLAMHGVDDAERFDRQVQELLRWFRPVSSEQVLQWYRGDGELPDRALWMTFDDGERSTLTVGAEVLARHGVPATVFVCPAFVGTEERPWWETVTAAVAAGGRVELDGVGYTDERGGHRTEVGARRGPPTDRRRSGAAGAADGRAGRARRPAPLAGAGRRHRQPHVGSPVSRPSAPRRSRPVRSTGPQTGSTSTHCGSGGSSPTRTATARRPPSATCATAGTTWSRCSTTRSPPAREVRCGCPACDSTPGRRRERTAAVTSGWHSALFALRRGVAGRAGRARAA